MTRLSGPWPTAEVQQFLADATIPLRLAYTTDSGWPSVVSLWFVHRDGAIWCATQATANIVRHLRRDPRCGFEIAPDRPPYRGVRGQGRAEIDATQGEAILRELIARYLGSSTSSFARWLLRRAGNEVAIRIVPATLATWDYTERMRDISAER